MRRKYKGLPRQQNGFRRCFTIFPNTFSFFTGRRNPILMTGVIRSERSDRRICMSSELKGKKIAILATDGFEQAELIDPRKALDDAGATTVVISPKSGEIKGWDMKDWGQSVKVDLSLADANPNDYDALVLPGGVMNPDHLRMDPAAVNFVRLFVATGKTVAAICHGPWTLLEAGALKGRTVTSWPSLKTDIKNAGGNWIDQAVVTDGQFIFSRKPDDIPEFNKAIIESVAQGVHDHAHA
jgi:protease I